MYGNNSCHFRLSITELGKLQVVPKTICIVLPSLQRTPYSRYNEWHNYSLVFECLILCKLFWPILSNWRPSCKKGKNRLLADFHFLQTDLLWHEKHRSVIFLVDLHFILQKWRMQKNSVLLLNEKQKKPFVLQSFITRIITLISYCCFISASD